MTGLLDHLWQSTWFAGVAVLVVLCLRNAPARIRYAVWLAASLKFLVPFAVFGWIGRPFVWRTDGDAVLPPLVHCAATPDIAQVMLLPAVVNAALVLWVTVAVGLLALLLVSWRRCAGLRDRSAEYGWDGGLEVRTSDEIGEAVLIGVRNPVLIIPQRLMDACTREQVAAIVAHERSHAGRRDNLFAWCHAVVAALFWFHPMVWWIGRRLLSERELACDEFVIEEGHEPATYASALIVAGRQALSSGLAGAVSATGGDLPRRVRHVLTHARIGDVSVLHRILIVSAATACVALSVASGMTIISMAGIRVTAGARSIQLSDAHQPPFVIMDEGYLYARNVSLRQLISDVYSVNVRNVAGTEWLDRSRYDIELAASSDSQMNARELVADLLRQRFNLDLIVRPSLTVQSTR